MAGWAQKSELKHLYLPGPHRGLFNRHRVRISRIILCEAPFDALTFWVNGFQERDVSLWNGGLYG